MVSYKVEKYELEYDIDSERARISLRYKRNGRLKKVTWFPPLEAAAYLAGMLRADRTAYYVELASGEKWLKAPG